MADLLRKYRCRYVFSQRFGWPEHSYELVGAKGGLHLHITEMGERASQPYSAGLEIHYRTAPDDTAPSHDHCWLLKAPCWHDGTTLYAEEDWLPIFLANRHDHLQMFRLLCVEAEDRFAARLTEPKETADG